MPSSFTNSLLDMYGITKAVLYRTFCERTWAPPQPMFNVLQVKAGTEDTFEKFLSEAQTVSNRLKTPVSLGPFKTDDSRIYIYVTHYASTWYFIRVMFWLTVTLVTLKRTAATQSTSWTYCHPAHGPELGDLHNVLVVGIQGDTSDFQQLLRDRDIQPAAVVKRVKDVRGHSAGTYYVLADTAENAAAVESFRGRAGDLVAYKAATFS